MSRTCLFLCYLVLLPFENTQSQDIRATTEEGRTVILKTSGGWFFIDRSPLQDGRATLQDGRTVILSENGKWIFSKQRPSLPASSEEADRYFNSRYRFSVRPPTGWNMEKRSERSITWTHPTEVPGNKASSDIILRVDQFRQPMTLDQYVELIKTQFTEFPINESGATSIAGIDARSIVVVAKVGLTLKAFLFVDRQQGYTISIICNSEVFSRDEPLFNQTAYSFQFE